jgi:hypothetical protein
MVTITLSAVGAKNAASRLREFLATDGINLKQTHAYEALAQALGYANWNTLQALLNGASSPETAENSAKGLSDNRAVPMMDLHGRVFTAERLAEQAVARIAIPFDPEKFDKFVGFYQFGADAFLAVSRKEELFHMRLTGQGEVEIYPESETKFFALSHTPAQVTFNITTQGYADSLVLHQHGREHLARRVDESVVTASEAALQKYVADNKPSPEREGLLRRSIAAFCAGSPNYEDMAPGTIESTKRTWPMTRRTFLRLGKLTELKFLRVDAEGWDVYEAVFQKGKLIWKVGPLTPDHKLIGTWFEFP